MNELKMSPERAGEITVVYTCHPVDGAIQWQSVPVRMKNPGIFLFAELWPEQFLEQHARECTGVNHSLLCQNFEGQTNLELE